MKRIFIITVLAITAPFLVIGQTNSNRANQSSNVEKPVNQSENNRAEGTRTTLLVDGSKLSDTQQNAQQAKVQFGNPGKLILHGQNDQNQLQVAHDGMQFKNETEALDWIVKRFNAIPIYDQNARLVGVKGECIRYGNLYRISQDGKTIERIRDYVAEVLGGANGYLTIGRKRICVNPDRCNDNMDQAITPSLPYSFQKAAFSFLPSSKVTSLANSDFCDNASSRRYCISGNSWNTNLLFYRSIGSETEQVVGGYEEHDYFCFNWLIPWVCKRRNGSNGLSVTTTYYYSKFITPASSVVSPAYAVSYSCKNCPSISHHFWSVFFSIKLSPFRPDEPTSTFEANLIGVCGIHGGNGPEGMATGKTSSGQTGNCRSF